MYVLSRCLAFFPSSPTTLFVGYFCDLIFYANGNDPNLCMKKLRLLGICVLSSFSFFHQLFFWVIETLKTLKTLKALKASMPGIWLFCASWSSSRDKEKRKLFWEDNDMMAISTALSTLFVYFTYLLWGAYSSWFCPHYLHRDVVQILLSPY